MWAKRVKEPLWSTLCERYPDENLFISLLAVSVLVIVAAAEVA